MSDDVEQCARRVLEAAQRRGLTLATAESCTAGALAALLADAPGAGECFHGGFVVYSKENKCAVLGVPADLIGAHTAVSRQVAEAMATGALGRCPADLAIAITGVAGPEPDEDGNPVGLVHIAVAVRDGQVAHRRHGFAPDERVVLQRRAMRAALELAEDVLMEAPSDRKTSQTVA
jgi:nicotinamide-nucleotide amidase